MPNSKASVLAGLLADRPMANGTPQLYAATDTGQVWISFNETWFEIGNLAERVTFMAPSDPVQWLNMPAERTEFLGKTFMRAGVDARFLTRTRLSLNIVVAGPTGAFLTVEYSPDEGVTWFDFAPGMDTPINAVGAIIGPFATIAAGAKLGVTRLRLVGYGGSPGQPPQFGRVVAVIR